MKTEFEEQQQPKKSSSWGLILLILTLIYFGYRYVEKFNNRKRIDPVQTEIVGLMREVSKKLNTKEFLEVGSKEDAPQVLSFIIEINTGKFGISTLGVTYKNEMFANSPQIGSKKRQQLGDEFKSIADNTFSFLQEHLSHFEQHTGAYTSPQEKNYKIYLKTKDNQVLTKEFGIISEDNIFEDIGNYFLMLWDKMDK